ncbi:recombinase family protein [Streptomyces yatensis]|uniref:Recombinase family protein n=1 Tax=Streptomyces yatensis TaxID=155177 RepID=A0ABN2IP31_9ACTN|nr:recombinase family protein [Streptomyces yatensis]
MSVLSLWDDLQIPPQAHRSRVTLNLYDQLSAYIPKRPGAYLRISSDRFGLEAGVDRQQEDAEDTRQRLGWGPFAKIYKENDTSAFKKRKVIRDDGSIDWVVIRPKFRELLADLASGVIDGVVFYDLDRLVRQPRDLEDLIDIVEYVQRPAVGATGGRMNLINDSDRHMARMMCVMALKSSEDTSRRVARLHLACAQAGRVQGRIAYGWVRKGPDKGTRIPDEARVVVDIFDDCLTGETSYSIATKLNRNGVKPPAAKLWSSNMINKMLRNPRYAGMVSYAGKHRIDPALAWDGWSRVLFDEDGHPLLGTWERIVEPKVWSQVQFELQLRRQNSGITKGTSRPSITCRYLLSGILTCGHCGKGLVGHRSRAEGRRTYRCPPLAHGGCGGTSIAADAAEEAVERAMIAFLEKAMNTALEDELGTPEQLTTLRATLEHESTRKQNLLRRWTEGALNDTELTEEDFFAMLSGLNKKISRLRDAVTAAEGTPTREAPKAELLNGWRTGSLHQRRALLRRYLHGIAVRPPIKAKAFNRSHLVQERLRPHWKSSEEIAA